MFHYGKINLFWSLIIFGYLSFTTVRVQKKTGFNSCEFIKFCKHRKLACIPCLGEMHDGIQLQWYSIYPCLFSAFATQLLSTPVTSLNLRNQAPLFMELRPLQATNLNLSFVLTYVMRDAYDSLRFSAIFFLPVFLFRLLHSGVIPPVVVKTRVLNEDFSMSITLWLYLLLILLFFQNKTVR